MGREKAIVWGCALLLASTCGTRKPIGDDGAVSPSQGGAGGDGGGGDSGPDTRAACAGTGGWGGGGPYGVGGIWDGGVEPCRPAPTGAAGFPLAPTCMAEGWGIMCRGNCILGDQALIDCGLCDNPCGGEKAYCRKGVCMTCEAAKPGVLTTCPVGCAALNGDPKNCGACGNVCPPVSPACQDGICVRCELLRTSPPKVTCDGQCVLSTHDNCGACGRKCGALEFCLQSACHPCEAVTGYASCPGQAECTRLDSPEHCGGCGIKCPSYQYCKISGVSGMCVDRPL